MFHRQVQKAEQQYGPAAYPGQRNLNSSRAKLEACLDIQASQSRDYPNSSTCAIAAKPILWWKCSFFVYLRVGCKDRCS